MLPAGFSKTRQNGAKFQKQAFNLEQLNVYSICWRFSIEQYVVTVTSHNGQPPPGNINDCVAKLSGGWNRAQCRRQFVPEQHPERHSPEPHCPVHAHFAAAGPRATERPPYALQDRSSLHAQQSAVINAGTGGLGAREFRLC